MNARHWILAACSGLLSCLALPAWAAPDRAVVERLLSGYEVRIDQAKLDALGEGWDEVVCDLAESPDTRPLVRIRALASLGYAKSDRAAAILRVAVDEGTKQQGGLPVIAAAQALRSLVRLETPGLETTLVKLMDHPTLELRIGAAEGLAGLRSPAARALIEKRLKIEKDPVARNALERALKPASIGTSSAD